MHSTPRLHERPDYGVDGWAFVVGLLSGGAALAGAGTILTVVAEGAAARVIGLALLGLGAVALVPGLLGLLYVKQGKYRHRDRLLDRVAWRGDEQTLDIGTGGGLLLVGAARRAPTGRALGVDIWSTEDLSNNTYERAMRNARLEGVAERVEIRSEDARKLSFPDQSFDVVVSMLCIHNIDDPSGRQDALREAVRVCKSGGTVVISDLAHTETYATILAGWGLRTIRTAPFADTFPPQRIVEARKP